MHIEPGIVDAAKITLSYATAAGSAGLIGKMALDAIRQEGAAPLALRALATTALVFSFFEIFPHHPVGVSEVHLILGSTLFLIFGAGAAGIGLALGLLLQGLFFAPFDLPQYGMNLTTLIVPLFAMTFLARRLIPARTAYKDVGYGQALALSAAYQGGTVAWVAFWSLYGGGLGAANLAATASFGAAYMLVVLIEPVIDLAVLAIAKNAGRFGGSAWLHNRLFQPAA